MINSVNPINNITNTNSAVPVSWLASYKQAQDAIQSVGLLVYQSLSLLTASSDSGLTKEGLNNLKTLLENENLTDKSAYKLASTLLERFTALSSDGGYITEGDFTSALKFSVAQNFSKSSELNQLIQDGALKVSSELSDLYGYDTARTIALVQFLDTLSTDTVSKIVSGLKNAKAKSTIKPDSYYGNSTIQDYKSITSSQLKGPINITV